MRPQPGSRAPVGSASSAVRSRRIAVASGDSVSTTVGPVSVGEYGDDAAGYQIEATLEGEELTLDLYVDLLVVRQGRALALYSFVDVFTPFSGDRDPLVGAVVDRLAAAGV